MIKKILAGTFLIFGTFQLSAQPYPGGIATGLKFWVKANSGVTVSPTNTATQWNDMSGANITGNMTSTGVLTSNTAPGYAAGGINFNPHIVFDKTQPNALVSPNQFSGNTLFDPANTTILQVLKLHTFTGTGVWLKWQNCNTSARLGFEVNNGSNPGQLRFDFNGLVYAPMNVNDKYVLADFYMTPSGKGVILNGATNINATGTNNTTTCIGKLSIGNEPPIVTPSCIAGTQSVDPYPTTFDVAEIIIFNKALTAAERNRAESYLAVKYGFTLDQGTTYPNDYTSAGGTVIWNRANNLPFVNNIVGIGRDDASGLLQKQSKSINAAGIAVLYNGVYTGANLPALNPDNTNGFSADNSFLLIGDNAAGTTFTRCFSNGSASYLRMPRVWKAQKTGTVADVTIAVKTTDVPAGTKSLLVSTDSGFTAANTTVYPLTNAGGYYTRTVNLASANMYFTYAGDSLKVQPTSNSPLCVGDALQLFSNITVVTSYSWVGPAGFTSTDPNPVIQSAGTANAGTYTLSGSIAGCPVQSGSVVVAITPKPAPPTVTTPILYCSGQVALPLTAFGQNLKWYTDPIGGLGATVAPVPNTGLEDTVTYWVTQSVNGCQSIRSKMDIYVYTQPNGIILGNQDVICQGAVDSFYYFGNGKPDYTYDWHVPFKYVVGIGGGGQGPFIARFDSAGTYNVRLQVANHICVTPEILFPVRVKALPKVWPLVKENGCVDEVVSVSVTQASMNVDSYAWDFNSGEIISASYPAGPFNIKWHTAGDKVVSLIATAEGCPALATKDTISIHALPDARIDPPADFNVCTGDTITLEAKYQAEGYTYHWKPEVFFANNDFWSVKATIKSAEFVSLTVVDSFGCTNVDSIRFNAKPCCEVGLPSAFSPNNDGLNDIYRIITIGHHGITSFRIFNRWGQTVFESADELHGWDGKLNGVPQDLGVYYYYVKYKCSDGKYYEQKGELTLVR